MTRPRCLESEDDFWDNQLAVIKHLSFASLFVSAVLATAGCQKSVDFGRVQEEALAVVKVHTTELDVLQRRADRLQQRGRNIASSAPGVGDAGRTLADARAQLDQLRGLTSSAPTLIGNAAKTGQIEELSKVFDGLSERLDTGTARIRADLGAVENWMAYAESRAPAAAPPPPAPVAIEPVTGTPETAPPAPRAPSR